MTDSDKPSNIVPFGKYKGRPIEEVLIDDPSYLQWLSGQDWFRAKFTFLHQTIINRGTESEETPEHNALQVLFLDDELCQKIVDLVRPGLFKQARPQWDRCLHYDDWRTIPYPEMPTNVSAKFELRGVDVVVGISGEGIERYLVACRDRDSERWRLIFEDDACVKIEIKPSIGDDYPAVLRQMRANHSNVLLVRDYCGRGATRQQFIKTFAAASIDVVFLCDLERELQL